MRNGLSDPLGAASGLALFATGVVGLALLASHASSVEAPRAEEPAGLVAPASEPTAPAEGRAAPEAARPSTAAVVRYSALDPGAERAAKRTAEALASHGFEAPELRAVRTRLSSSSVRYFHDADREEAARVIAATSGALRSAGFQRARLQDLRHYEPRPEEGALEIWIGRDRAAVPAAARPPLGRATSARAGFEAKREYP